MEVFFMDPADVLTVTIIVLVPVALLITTLRYRSLWRSAGRQLTELRSPEKVLHSSEPLMHAVDAIAVEVERISEGQRYLTKVLAGPGTPPSASSLPPKNQDG